jgi:hypothetical protein
LIGAIEKNIDAVRNSADFETAFKAKDAALMPLFAASAKPKPSSCTVTCLPGSSRRPCIAASPIRWPTSTPRARAPRRGDRRCLHRARRAALPKADAVTSRRSRTLEAPGAEEGRNREAARLALAADAEASLQPGHEGRRAAESAIGCGFGIEACGEPR